MSARWSRFVAFVGREEPGHRLALFRVLCGLCIVQILTGAVWHDTVGLAWMDVAHGGYKTPSASTWLVTALGGPAQATWPLVWTGIASGLLLALGAGGRITAFVALQVMMAIFRLNGASGGGHDRLLTNGLWLLVLSPSTATWSLDCWLRQRRWNDDRPVWAFPRYLAIWQLGLLYCTAGIQKVGAEWMPWGGFRALYYALQIPEWQRVDVSWLAWVSPFLAIGTALSLAWEWSWPVTVWATWTADSAGRSTGRRAWVRDVYVAWGVVMHVMLFVFMDLGPFSSVTLAFYPCLFGPGELSERAAAWRALIGKLLGGRTAGTAKAAV